MSRLRTALPFLLAIAIVSAGLWAYAPTFGFGFLAHDDPEYVPWHPEVRQGLTLHGLRWALSGITLGNWHPVTWLSHMLDVELFGMVAGRHHATSVGLHLLSSLAVFALFRSMTGATLRSAAVAALFALHPLHVESVAWIAERKDVLATLFGVLSLLAWLTYLRRGARLYHGLALAALAASLGSKGMLVTLPFVMVLLDVWPLARAAPEVRALLRSAREKLPFFALSLGSAVITWAAQASSRFEEIPLGFRIGNAALAYLSYLEHAFWPTGLAAIYPYRSTLPPLRLALAAVVCLGITGLAIALRRRALLLFTGWFWFSGALLPVLGLVQVGYQASADRYVYFPSLGLYAVVVFGAHALLARSALPARARDAGLLVAALAALAALAGKTRAQVELWRDDFTLFTHALSVTEDNFFAETWAGMALLRAGRHEDALPFLERGMALNPLYAPAAAGWAHVQRARGLHADAVRGYARALRLDPTLRGAHAALGLELERFRAFDAAVHNYESELALDPDHARAMERLAVILANHSDPERRDVERALALARRACELSDWLDPGALDALASAEAAAGRLPEAIAHAERAAARAREQGEEARAVDIETRLAEYRARPES
jgi:tetratricopeptide (TPR) repeat protein